MDISTLLKYTLNEDSVGDYLVTPAVAYFCFDSIDFDFEKINPVIEEDIYDDVKKEQKALKKNKTSDITGTVYTLSSEQKRCLKYLKKKYGKALINDIKKYRKETLAPYQVAKSYVEKSKALYPKDVFGMTKEDYLKYKKSAENKIENMRSNRYSDLTREMMTYYDKSKKLNDLEDFMGVHDISEPAINKLFKKYGIYSTRYSEADMRSFRRSLENVEKIKKQLLDKIASNDKISKDDSKKLRDAINEVRSTKTELSQKEDDTERNLRELKSLAKKIDDINAPEELKDSLNDILNNTEDAGIKITAKSFEQEYENFLIREKIREDIRKKKDTKYTNDYKRFVQDLQGSLDEKKKYTISKMAKERESKTLNDFEKKIYELKPGASSDSDRLSDYTLKIKEEDFFNPKFYQKSDKFKDAERKIDAEIKRFERSLEGKMEPKDFQLLKKYRLISNLITIKNASLKDVFGREPQEQSNETENNNVKEN